MSRAVDALQRAGRQAVAVGVLFVVSVIVLIDGVRSALAVVTSAGLVLVVLAMVAAARGQQVHDRALDVILHGGESVPIDVVQRQRRRLARPRTRHGLARAIDRTIEEACDPPRLCGRGVRPLFHTEVVAPVADQLGEVALLLRCEQPSVRGVAHVERLLTDGTSPLYGLEARLLSDELGTISYALGGSRYQAASMESRRRAEMSVSRPEHRRAAGRGSVR